MLGEWKNVCLQTLKDIAAVRHAFHLFEEEIEKKKTILSEAKVILAPFKQK